MKTEELAPGLKWSPNYEKDYAEEVSARAEIAL